MRKIGIDKAEVDATRIIEDSDEYLVVPAIISREGVFPYPKGKAFKPAAELKENAWTADGAWIVAERHPDKLIVTHPSEVIGRSEQPYFCDQINGIRANLRFDKKRTNPRFLSDIKSGNRKDVSVGFFYDFDPTPGEFKGQHYDFVQRHFLINHVAAGVPVGRCPSPFCGVAVDAVIRKFAVDPEETDDFVHVPVRDAGDFVEDSFKTIDIDAEKGIKAVIGKLKSDPEGSTHVQKYLFDKSKDWTMEKAKSWVEEHKKAAADAAVDMTLEEIKQKIAELGKKRDELYNKLYPQPELTDEDRSNLEAELAVLYAELEAYQKVLEEKIASSHISQKPETDAKTEIARTKRLLQENR